MPTTDTATWKTVTEYPWLEVSDTGLVRSLPGRRHKVGRPRAGRVLKQQVQGKYLKISCDNKGHLIHRLVALAFIPNPDNKPQVCHKDGNKHNNHVDNLIWATVKELMIHAASLGLKTHGEDVHCAKLTEAKVRAIRGNQGWRTQAQLASIYGVSVITIQQVLYRKTWKHVV